MTNGGTETATLPMVMDYNDASSYSDGGIYWLTIPEQNLVLKAGSSELMRVGVAMAGSKNKELITNNVGVKIGKPGTRTSKIPMVIDYVTASTLSDDDGNYWLNVPEKTLYVKTSTNVDLGSTTVAMADDQILNLTAKTTTFNLGTTRIGIVNNIVMPSDSTITIPEKTLTL